MASTKMFTQKGSSSNTFFHQQSSTNGNPLMDEDTTLTQEMHVKMAKKIAQLTKVIYALNTKADEHETIVTNLKQAFEQEKTVLAKNASARIDELLQRVEKLSSIKSSQNTLYENKIQMLESERQSQVNELLRIQQTSIEREHELAEEFRSKISNLKQEIGQIKKLHDQRIASLNGEHQEIITKLHDEHQIELDNLKSEFKHLFDVENQAQKQFYLQTIEDLKRQHDNLLNKDKDRDQTEQELNDDYQRKIQDLQNQIEQMQTKFQLEIDEERNLRVLKTNEYQQLKEQFEQYKLNYNAKSNDFSELNEQLIKQRQEYDQLKQNFDQKNKEINTVKERFNRQAAELEEKLKLLKEKDSLNRQLENELKKVEKELKLTNDRLQQLEVDQHAQLTQSESTTNYLERRIHELDKTIHQMTLEKQQIMSKYDRELTDLRDTYENQVGLCKKEMQGELDRLSEHYQELINDEQIRAKTKLQSKEQELKQQFELEKTNLLSQWNNEIDQSKSEQKQINQELQKLKDYYELQISQLKKDYEETKDEYDALRKQFADSQTSNSQSKKQIDKLQNDLDEQIRSNERFYNECEQLKKRCQEIEINSANELKEKLEQLTKDLNDKWTRKLKFDTEKIRKDLTQQKDEEKQKAIDELLKQKQSNISSAQTQINELEQQIAQLQKQLLVEQQKAKDDNLVALQNANEDKRRLMNEFQMKIQDLNTQIQRLEGKNQEELLEQKLQLEKDHLNQINELKTRQMEDIRGQQLAYSTHLETIRADHERALALEIEKQNIQHQSNFEQLRKDLIQTHANEIEEKERAFSKELAAVRLQLDRALEITKIKEREADLRIDDLTSDLKIKQTKIDNYIRDLNDVQDQIEQLRQEIDIRSKEVQRVRNDMQKEIKAREEKLRNDNEDKLRELRKIHDDEQKQLLEEFGTAHDLLKSKIADLQIKLHEAEERYRNRESRNEDLDLITTLQQTIASYQEQLKKIHDEKKYLKMELVNRETTYNKVFTNAPSSNIGVMNPLSFNTKFIPRNSDSNSSVHTRLKSQSPRPTKLEPLVATNDIPHDLPLNPNKHLLPKRFVK